MKILLIGNYPYLKSQSMPRFAAVLSDGLKAAGHEVRLLKPPPAIGRIFPTAKGIGKWLGYFDRFLLFPPFLKKAASWADMVHICDHANAVYVPWLKGKPHMVTCHDMLAIRSALGEIRHHRTGPSGRIYQRWILAGLKKAQHVVCISRSTSDDLLRLTGLDSSRVSVVLMGLNLPYHPMSEKESLHYLDQIGFRGIKPFFMHIGNNNWYKNKVGLLKIFAQMVRLGGDKIGNLVIAGTSMPESLCVLAQNIGIYDCIREAPDVNNEQLCALYSSTQGLIFPSLAEGFGWPIIEAQACGCPVFTSNREPMTEVGGDGAVYFDPLDEAGAAEIILQEIQNKGRLKERGYRNVVKYSTEAMIAGYLNVYKCISQM